MSGKMHDYNEKKIQPNRPLEKDEAVPGTGHDTKKLKQKGH